MSVSVTGDGPNIALTGSGSSFTITVTTGSGGGGGGGGGASTLDELTDVTVTAAASGDILRYNGTAWVDTPGTTHFDAAGTAAGLVAGIDAPTVRVALIQTDPTGVGGSYAADVWTIAALNSLPTTGYARLIAVIGTDPDDMSAASSGLFEHTGAGSFSRVQAWSTADTGKLFVASIELVPGAGSTCAWLYLVGGAAVGYSLFETPFDPTDIETDIATLTNRLDRYYPATPVVPHLHVSKYVTFDPDFPLDGTATHVGGQAIEAGQNLTILDNGSGNGGVWTLSLTGAATRATGFGSMVDTDIGQYDHVSFTGTRWAYFALFRLYGDPTTMGMSPVPPDHTGIFGGEGVSRSYRPDLIATDLTGDNLTVLEADGSTTVASVAAQTGVLCALVLDNLTLVTIDGGVVEQTEDFATADGVWLAQGVGGVGVGTTVAVMNSGYSVLSQPGEFAAASHTHAASDVTSGTVATARLGSGTADGTTFLRGDQTWATPASGGGTWATIVNADIDSAAYSIDVTGYRRIRLSFTGRSTRTSSSLDSLFLRFNNDTGSNYSTQAGALAGPSSQQVPASQTNTNRRTQIIAQITLGSSEDTIMEWSRAGSTNSTTDTGTATSSVSVQWIGSRSNAVTSIDLVPNVGPNIVGRLLVEGVLA